jgi:hypothetical protein
MRTGRIRQVQLTARACRSSQAIRVRQQRVRTTAAASHTVSCNKAALQQQMRRVCRSHQRQAAWISGTSAGWTGNVCCGCCLPRSMAGRQSGGRQHCHHTCLEVTCTRQQMGPVMGSSDWQLVLSSPGLGTASLTLTLRLP